MEFDVVKQKSPFEHGMENPQYYQVLNENGELQEPIKGKIDEALMIEMYKKMKFVRFFDRKCVILQRQGKLGTYAPFEGQEASQVGSALALSPEDWLFPTYRDHAAAITHGQDLFRVFLYWMGHPEGSICTEGLRILPPTVPIATQMLHAVGTSWASKLKTEKNVSIAYFGDGATSEGDFHEALNFAGVFQTPTVFFCQNNGFAISVPFERQSASKTIAQRAHAYDMKGIRLDGNDIFAVYLSVKEAIKRAQNGEGSTLIEAVTFRYGAHTTADDPKKYRNQDVLSQQWREQRDPLLRLHKYLLKKGLWNEDLEEESTKQMNEQVDQAFEKAVQYPKANPISMFSHVYAETPWNIKEQQQSLQTFLGKDVKH